MTSRYLDRLSEVKARLQAATPGPWRWDYRPGVKLIELRSPGYTVMAFFRWGMRQAAPAFLHNRWLLRRPHQAAWGRDSPVTH